MEKILLYIPLTGFYDVLAGLTRSMNYCRKYNRTLLISMNQGSYHVEFNQYFDLFEPDVRIVYDRNVMKELLRGKTIYNQLDMDLIKLVECQDIHTVGCHRNHSVGWITDYNNVSLVIPDKDVEEDVIVHVSSMGDITIVGEGSTTFKKLILKEQLKEICRERLSRLNHYLCIQVRCTDYRCDYEKLYEDNKELIHSYPEVYVATDQKEAVQYFKSKGLNVFCFTTFPEGSYYNLHYSNVDKHTHFCDMIADVFIATNSSQLLSNSRGGYIQLMRDCFKEKSCILEKLI